MNKIIVKYIDLSWHYMIDMKMIMRKYILYIFFAFSFRNIKCIVAYQFYVKYLSWKVGHKCPVTLILNSD